MGIIVSDVWKQFGKPPTTVLQSISFEIKEGEFVSLTGRSGSGKSTLLYLISSLDNPTKGHVEIAGSDLTTIKSRDLHKLRNQHIGFVFQFHYLLPELSALENVLMPAMKCGRSKERTAFASELLDRFGLGAKLDRRPSQLSGGEQQRVAIARSLVLEPKYLFADEPTGSLDTVNGELVMNILTDINRTKGTTIVLVTHDPDFAALASRQIFLSDGKLTSDTTKAAR